jgi:tetratricopeptide (TPR) repeat protein
MIPIKFKNMKTFTVLILLIVSQIAYSQNDDDKILIQNYYESCKSKNYSAFSAVNTGIQLFDTRQYSRSLKNFEKALEKDPNCCDAWYLIGYCYQKTGDFQKSIDACDKSLDINPNNLSALVIKANTIFLMNDTLTAIELFRKAKEINTNKIDAYYGLALMLHLTGKNNDASLILSEMDSKDVKTINVRDNKKIKDLKKKVQ